MVKTDKCRQIQRVGSMIRPLRNSGFFAVFAQRANTPFKPELETNSCAQLQTHPNAP